MKYEGKAYEKAKVQPGDVFISRTNGGKRTVASRDEALNNAFMNRVDTDIYVYFHSSEINRIYSIYPEKVSSIYIREEKKETPLNLEQLRECERTGKKVRWSKEFANKIFPLMHKENRVRDEITISKIHKDHSVIYYNGKSDSSTVITDEGFCDYYLSKGEKIYVFVSIDAVEQTVQVKETNPVFCSCSSPNLVKRTTGIGAGPGSWYNFCICCKKERQ